MPCHIVSSEGKRAQRNLESKGHFVVHPEILPTKDGKYEWPLFKFLYYSGPHFCLVHL